MLSARCVGNRFYYLLCVNSADFKEASSQSAQKARAMEYVQTVKYFFFKTQHWFYSGACPSVTALK